MIISAIWPIKTALHRPDPWYAVQEEFLNWHIAPFTIILWPNEAIAKLLCFRYDDATITSSRIEGSIV